MRPDVSTGSPESLDARLSRFRARRGGESPAALAGALLDAGRTADALEVTALALASHPDDAEALLVDGRARLAAGDLLGAQAALLKAAKVAPHRKDPFRWLGEVLLKRGDPQRAAKVLERALAIDSHDRAIALLHERATRLANIAAGAEPEPPAPSAPAPAEERTVIRTDLTEQLRTMTREADAAAKKPPQVAPPKPAGRPPEPALTLSAPDAFGADAFEDEATSLAGAAIDDDDLDDEPTNIVSAASIAAATAPKRRPKQTLTLGSAGAPPPAGGLADAAPAARPQRAPAASALGMPPKAAAPLPPPAALPTSPRPKAPPFQPPGRGAEPAAPTPPRAKADPFPPPGRGADPFAAPEPPPDPFPPPKAEPELPSYPVMPAPSLDERPRGPAPEPERPELEEDAFAVAAPEEPVSLEPPEDVALGGAGREDVDAVLEMLRAQGLFEPPAGESAQWAPRAEVKKTQASGTRIGIWLGAAWLLAIGLAVGGWYGWQWWTERRHAQAAELVARAREQAFRGTHADLVDAERLLREARELHPTDLEGPKLLLFVHAQRALEDGAFEAGYLRPSIARAEQLEADSAYLDVARAVLAAAEGGQEQARARLASALEARGSDAAILYVAGRLEQRLGGETALDHLQAAIEADGDLVAPRIALAEVRHDEGQAEEALALLDAVLADAAEHLRAVLWRAFLTSDGEEPAAALAAIARLEEDIDEHGAPTDHVLFELTRARLLRRQGQTAEAGAAVDEALLAGASEPRLLALVATEGRRAGRLLRAEQAARAAVAGAPRNADFKKLLAGIQLARRNGRGALTTLADLDAADPDVLEMRALAALLVGTREALEAAAAGLDAEIEASPEASVGLRALRIRTHAQLGDGGGDLLAQARALSADAPGDPAVALALGEAALLARDARTAVDALSQAVLAAPDDSEAHYLLGRAKRLAGDADGAEQALRRAVELTPEHTEAQLALGGLLLDRGDYPAADTLYTSLSSSGRSSGGLAVTVAGRLGRVEALIGLGRIDDAAVQLEAVRDAARETASARMTAARLALARGRPGDALGELRPLATQEGAGPTVLALYGDALLAAAQTDPAAEAYAGALAQDSGLPEALLGQAELAVRAERGAEALEGLAQAERALEARIRPPGMRARVLTLRGRAALLERDAGAAREALRAAAALDGAPAEAHFFLGEALADEDAAAARASYERYLELAPEGPFAARARRAIARR